MLAVSLSGDRWRFAESSGAPWPRSAAQHEEITNAGQWTRAACVGLGCRPRTMGCLLSTAFEN